MLPIRCFTCNKFIGDAWKPYCKGKLTQPNGAVLDEMNLTRICCRRMLLTHVTVIDDIMHFSNADSVLDESQTRLFCEVKDERTVKCV